jgi:hypothetical protein
MTLHSYQLAEIHWPFWIGMALILAGVLVFAMVIVSNRLTREQPAKDESHLLGKALGLTSQQRRLIQDLADRAGEPVAAALMISEGCFDAACRRATLNHDEQHQLQKIRQHIFI